MDKAAGAACQYAKGTRWCTSGNDAAKRYLEKSPLYVFFKNHEKIAQGHFGDAFQLMDPMDRRIEDIKKWAPLLDSSGLTRKHPIIAYEKAIRLGPDENTESIVASHPEVAYKYARDVLVGRFPAGEKAIASDPEVAYRYASDMLGGRFPAGEKAIASKPWSAYRYAIDVLRDRFPAGEKAIASHPKAARMYARDVLRGQ